MYAFCRNNGILLIILDIPQSTAPGVVETSVPVELRETMQTNNDGFISSEEVLNELGHAARFHVPHGQRHISELTHLALGQEVGSRILEMVRDAR
jgi:hypothetical protein